MEKEKLGQLIQVNFGKKRFTTSLDYKARILGMDKLELLEEMVRFQEQRSREGRLTPQMMVDGQVLFQALRDSSETPELRLLTNSYLNHLRYEYDAYLKG